MLSYRFENAQRRADRTLTAFGFLSRECPMKTIGQSSAVAIVLLFMSSGVASADIDFNLTGVTLNGGGTLTGWFITNNSMTTVESYSITASKNSGFAGFTYTQSDSSVTAAVLPSQFFQIDGGSDELRLYFSSALTPNGATLSTGHSYEFEGASRAPTAGRVVAVAAAAPEPSSLVITSVAVMLGGGWYWWRRKRATRGIIAYSL
jgi:hypothetical protein